MIKIHVLQTGRVSVDIGVPLRQKNPFAVTGFFRSAKHRVWLPVTSYLIEHPNGLVLIDTGWHVCKVNGAAPDWFKKGIDAALLAPTAMNQQKFKFILNDNKVKAKAGIGFYSKIDLGIAKYHFEIGAQKENFIWE